MQEPGLIIGASSYNIAAVAAAFGRASLALADAMVQWNTCALDPVSDAWLRDAAAAAAEATEAHLPPPERRRRLLSFGEMPPPALTLMLGAALPALCVPCALRGAVVWCIDSNHAGCSVARVRCDRWCPCIHMHAEGT